MCITLLDETEAAVFPSYGANAIALSKLPQSVAQKLLTDGSTILNVKKLSSDSDLQEVVRKELARLHLDQGSLNNDGCRWLSRFWAWFASSTFASRTDLALAALAVVPCSDIRVRRVDDIIFAENSVSSDIIKLLCRCGIAFYHPELNSVARSLLHGRSSSSAVDLVSSLDPKLVSKLSSEEISLLRRHLSSSHASDPRKPVDSEKLKLLPIFTHLIPSYNNKQLQVKIGMQIDTLNTKATVHFVQRSGQNPQVPVPEIPGHIFVDANDLGQMMACINKQPFPIRENEIVELAFQNLGLQSPILQLAFTELVAAHPNFRSHNVISSIKQTPLVTTRAGNARRIPETVIDEISALKELCVKDDSCLPAQDPLNEKMAHVLRQLGLLQAHASTEFVAGRIALIDEIRNKRFPEAYALAERLIKYLDDTSFNCNNLATPTHLCWLPANPVSGSGQATLSGIVQCYDAIHRDLFDRVWNVPTVSVASMSLRKLLGWNVSLPLSVLVGQLEAVLAEPDTPQQCKLLRTIIREFGLRIGDLKRDIASVEALHRVVPSDRRWIPFSNANIKVSSLKSMLRPGKGISGFHQVPFDLVSCSGVKEFLVLMGCQERYEHSNFPSSTPP